MDNKGITSLDLHYLSKDFSILIGAKIGKIYQQEKNKKDFLFEFHKPSYGKIMLRAFPPGLVFITEKRPKFPQTPPGFCVFLRKYLSGSVVQSVEQHNFERVLLITFLSGEKKFILIIELFSTGNMVLCDEDFKIKSPLESQNWKDRTIRGGINYSFPPERVNAKTISLQNLSELLSSGSSLVKSLAVKLGLGGAYAEELCLEAGVDKNSCMIDEKVLKSLHSLLKRMFEKPGPAVAAESMAFPFRLKTTAVDFKDFESFSQAVDFIIDIPEYSDAVDPAVVQGKISDIRSKQQEKIAELTKQAEELQSAGGLIYENYSDIAQILFFISSARKKGMPWTELKQSLAKSLIFVSVDESKKEIILDLGSKDANSPNAFPRGDKA